MTCRPKGGFPARLIMHTIDVTKKRQKEIRKARVPFHMRLIDPSRMNK